MHFCDLMNIDNKRFRDFITTLFLSHSKQKHFYSIFSTSKDEKNKCNILTINAYRNFKLTFETAQNAEWNRTLFFEVLQKDLEALH